MMIRNTIIPEYRRSYAPTSTSLSYRSASNNDSAANFNSTMSASTESEPRQQRQFKKSQSIIIPTTLSTTRTPSSGPVYLHHNAQSHPGSRILDLHRKNGISTQLNSPIPMPYEIAAKQQQHGHCLSPHQTCLHQQPHEAAIYNGHYRGSYPAQSAFHTSFEQHGAQSSHCQDKILTQNSQSSQANSPKAQYYSAHPMRAPMTANYPQYGHCGPSVYQASAVDINDNISIHHNTHSKPRETACSYLQHCSVCELSMYQSNRITPPYHAYPEHSQYNSTHSVPQATTLCQQPCCLTCSLCPSIPYTPTDQPTPTSHDHLQYCDQCPRPISSVSMSGQQQCGLASSSRPSDGLAYYPRSSPVYSYPATQHNSSAKHYPHPVPSTQRNSHTAAEGNPYCDTKCCFGPSSLSTSSSSSFPANKPITTSNESKQDYRQSRPIPLQTSIQSLHIHGRIDENSLLPPRYELKSLLPMTATHDLVLHDKKMEAFEADQPTFVQKLKDGTGELKRKVARRSSKVSSLRRSLPSSSHSNQSIEASSTIIAARSDHGDNSSQLCSAETSATTNITRKQCPPSKRRHSIAIAINIPYTQYPEELELAHTKDPKRRKLLQNRMALRRLRVRRAAEMEALKDKVSKLKQENDGMKASCARVWTETKMIEGLVVSLSQSAFL